MNWEAIAELAYKQYWLRRTQGGQKPKEWAELSESERIAWIAAIKEACRVHILAATT